MKTPLISPVFTKNIASRGNFPLPDGQNRFSIGLAFVRHYIIFHSDPTCLAGLNSFLRVTAFLFSKRRQLLSESVFPSVAGKNSDWLSLSRAFSVSSGKYSLAVRRKYGFARLFRNLSEKSRLRCFAVLSVRKAYKTRQPNAIVL